MPGYNIIKNFVEINFIESTIENENMREKISHWAKDEDRILSIAICFKNPDKGLFAGLHLPNEIYENEVNVFIRQEVQYGFSLAERDTSVKKENRFKNVYFFGMLSEVCDLEFNRDDLAKSHHLNYIETLKRQGKYNPIEYAGHNNWEDLSEEMKWSNRYVVDIYHYKLRALKNMSSVFSQYSFEEYRKYVELAFEYFYSKVDEKSDEQKLYEFKKDINLLAEIEHRRWMVERVLSGWKYGLPKDERKRLNPYLVPYRELNDEVKLYDIEISVDMFKIIMANKNYHKKLKEVFK
jgi:hypothetical protein